MAGRSHFIALRSAELEEERLQDILMLTIPRKTALTMLSAEGDDDARFSEDFADAAILFIDLADSSHWIQVYPVYAVMCVVVLARERPFSNYI